MRVLAATGIVVALAALAGGAQAREATIYRGKCGQVVLPSGTTGLDAAIRIETRCGTFSVGRQGVRFVGVRRPVPMRDGLGRRRGRLVLYGGGRIIWRSTLRHPRHARSALVVHDDRSVAFHYWGGPLYVAAFGGPERPVGHLEEFPLGWTEAGILVTSWRQRLQARTRSGRLVGIPRGGMETFRFDERTRTLLFVSHSRDLVRTDGRHVESVASLSSLGLGRWAHIEPLPSGRIALVGERFAVLEPDGAVVSTAAGAVSTPTEGPDGAIATISTRFVDNNRRAVEAIRLVRPGSSSSRLLFAHRFAPAPCAHASALAWRGHRLLYWTTEGHVVVIDTRSGDNVDLTAAVARLPGSLNLARWA